MLEYPFLDPTAEKPWVLKLATKQSAKDKATKTCVL
jgi:hypothetical protein